MENFRISPRIALKVRRRLGGYAWYIQSHFILEKYGNPYQNPTASIKFYWELDSQVPPQFPGLPFTQFNWTDKLQEAFKQQNTRTFEALKDSIKTLKMNKVTYLCTSWRKIGLNFVHLQKYCHCKELTSVHFSLLGFYPETWQVFKLSINLLTLAGLSTNISADKSANLCRCLVKS